MPKPIVAIVGRPNVGKSTLFNKIAGRRIAIVESEPGVTRDRLYADAEWLSHRFTLIDTGGLDPSSDDLMLRHIYAQAEVAIDTADVIMFVVDIKTGPLEQDALVADTLRRANKPVVLVVNKVDDMRSENLDVYEFYSLGLGDPVPVSAGQALGLGDLLDEVARHFPERDGDPEDDDVIKVAVVGKPNSGKSSLINKILGEQRVIVSDVPGTTRDAIDTPCERDGQKFIFIDTAGIRRKSRIKENVEHYAIVRAIAAVERSDVCVVLLDAQEPISEQDVKIAGIAHERGKAIVIAVNKWDLIEKDNHTMKSFEENIAVSFSFMPYAVKIFISALTGQRVNKITGAIISAYRGACMRVSTGTLNDTLADALAMRQPPSDRGKPLRVYYVTQASVRPPTFVLFVNDTELMHYSYKRYIENRLRDAFGFLGTPVRFIIRNRKT